MKIFIDADGCPVVDITVSEARINKIECILICDTAHEFNIKGIETVKVEKGPDSADFRLVNMVSAGDIVVTQDYGLAAMCMSKKAVPVSQDGMVFTENNIGYLLEQRHSAKKIRMAGGRLKGSPKRTNEQNKNFRASLQKLINELYN